MRDSLIAAGFGLFAATGLHRTLAPMTRGRGAILMFHHVCPPSGDGFAPNRLLEITPSFLETVLMQLAHSGFETVSLDAALARLARPAEKGEKPFAVLTFDDGYRDNQAFALPVLRRHAAPFVLYVTTGFADRSARLWWRELEAAIRQLDHFSIGGIEFACAAPAAKSAAFERAYWILRAMDETAMLAQIAGLCRLAGIGARALVETACLDWDGIAAMAAEPLCTVGVHTLTHPMLAKHPAGTMELELCESRSLIEAHLGRPARHLSYPVGDAASAGRREFEMAAKLGFASAVTTRPGMIFSAHSGRLMSLPRLSINGKWQNAKMVEVLLSGAPFAVLNKGRPA